MNELWEQNKPIILKELALALFALWVASAFYCHFAGYSLSQSFPWMAFHSFSDPYITEGQMFIIWCLAGATFMGINAIMFIDLRGNEARFANASDLRKGGHLVGKGVALGKKGNTYLYSDDNGHILCAAMTQSGKGVGLVIPNLLNWPNSAIVLDMKGELYRITAGFRQSMGHKIVNFAPFKEDGDTDCFNPFDFVDFGTDKETRQINRIGEYAFPKGTTEQENFWVKGSRALFLAIVLYLNHTPKKQVTFGEVWRFMNENANFEKHLEAILESQKDLPETIRYTFNFHVKRAEKEQSGVRSMMYNYFELWSDERLDRAMSSTTFDFKSMRKRPTTLYLGVPFIDTENLAPLIALLLMYSTADLATEEFDKDKEQKVLFLLDEFASIGRLRIMERITDFAGYGIRLFCIMQNLAQLDKVYGRDSARVILANFRVKVFFGVDDETTSKSVSSSLGLKTVKKRTKSYKSGSGVMDAPTVSESRERVPLMTPSDVMLMPDKEMLILKTGQRPVRCKKIVYYKDKNLKDKANMPIKRA